MPASLAKLYAIAEDLHVYPGHGGFSTLAQEKENNPYLRGAGNA